MKTRCLRWSSTYFSGFLMLIACLALLAPSDANASVRPNLPYVGSAVHYLGGIDTSRHRAFTIVMKRGTTLGDAQIVAQYFDRFGISIRLGLDHKFLFAEGSYAQSAAAAHISFVRVAAFNDVFITSTRAPSFPAFVSSRIVGTTIVPGPHLRPMRTFSPNDFLVGSGDGFSPAELASIYDFPTPDSDSGKGQNVDIAACRNVDPEDFESFGIEFDLAAINITIHHIDGIDEETDTEPELDVERVYGTAQAAHIDLYLVPEDDCTNAGFVDMYAAIEESHKPGTMSISYGQAEDTIPQADLDTSVEALNDVVDTGVMIFVASGDDGAFTAEQLIGVEYPASDPCVLSVGGTVLGETSEHKRLYEYAWQGSGGGVSNKFEIRGYQVDIGGASNEFKNLPDVSLVAHPATGYIMFDLAAGGFFPTGGTSGSAPTWAGIVALVNQKRVALRHGVLTNPAALYAARETPGVYTDITEGDNGFYKAHAGYDNVTGLGVPDVKKLIAALQ
jgi:kumamolisin